MANPAIEVVVGEAGSRKKPGGLANNLWGITVALRDAKYVSLCVRMRRRQDS